MKISFLLTIQILILNLILTISFIKNYPNLSKIIKIPFPIYLIKTHSPININPDLGINQPNLFSYQTNTVKNINILNIPILLLNRSSNTDYQILKLLMYQ